MYKIMMVALGLMLMSAPVMAKDKKMEDLLKAKNFKAAHRYRETSLVRIDDIYDLIEKLKVLNSIEKELDRWFVQDDNEKHSLGLRLPRRFESTFNSSKEFFNHITAYENKIHHKYNIYEQEISSLLKAREDARVAAIKEAKDKKELDHKNKRSRLDQRFKKAGYLGFSGSSILMFIIGAQYGSIDLNDHMNSVFGCEELIDCNNEYRKVRLIQVLDDLLLYSYHKYRRSGSIDATFFVEKDKNKMYLNGQRLENRFYVFKGVHTYTTVNGSTNTVPIFHLVK